MVPGHSPSWTLTTTSNQEFLPLRQASKHPRFLERRPWDECINLDLFITNDDGKLIFKKLSDSILLSGLCFQLQGTKLCGSCITPGGKFQYSEIDLNSHYSNINGTFHSDDRGYAATGKSFRLEVNPTALTLVGELRNYSHNYQKAEANLSVCIVNDNGRLKFVKQ
ncbi:Cyanovirin-N [Byssothecium circinans]|uniref:Cyanovirin-N n=1 Tax=Byssothecium circinans TaxID=147558 RepID=A0A6A5UDT7_9PLEO|nr:Cyanovirin-N [Byssothecium circinans]